jgi:hypothetical protein
MAMQRYPNDVEPSTSSTKRVLALTIGIVILFLASILSFWIVENVDAKNILVIQDAVDGDLNWYKSAGIKLQWFGTATEYEKLQTYEFEIPVRFNDGGHGKVIGSVNYELPLDDSLLTTIHTKYGSKESVQDNLVKVVTNKCVYMTGPLMSSKESYAEKRTSLIFYIEDQIKNGVYKTIQKDVKTKDPITGVDKTVTVAEILIGKDGKPERQEVAVLAQYGIITSNFAVTELPYDETVENQIKQQQVINMNVQTEIANAKQAEQKAITAEKEGQAKAATAKWEQEVVKAQQVTLAQQRLEVASLERKAAEQNKLKNILDGEGIAARRRLEIQANGALEQKLDAYVKVNQAYAEAIGKYQGNWVPTIVMDGTGKTANATGVQGFLDLIKSKFANDLALDFAVKK